MPCGGAAPRLNEERLALGHAWNDRDLVFPNAIGNPLEAPSMARR
jgi:integrase